MDKTQKLPAYFRKLAAHFRQVVDEQDISVLAREIDVVLPTYAGQLLCRGLDDGHLKSGASWDLRHYAMGPNEDSYRWFLRLNAGGKDAEAFWPAGSTRVESEPSLGEKRLEAVLQASRLTSAALTDEQENLARDIGFLCSWWQFILERWESDSLRFPPDTERHFSFLRLLLTVFNQPDIPDAPHRYPPLAEKNARSRLRLRGAAALQATACEIVAELIESPDPDPDPETIDPESGKVTNPSEISRYIPAVKIVNEHTPPELKIGEQRLHGILKRYPIHKVRWTRPLDKNGKPRGNRRNVHLLDWENYLRTVRDENPDGTDFVGPGEKEMRQALTQIGKEKRL